MDKIKLIIDTDIGDDIDDAYALSLAYRLDYLDILGITSVNKNALERAYLTRYLNKLANQDIEVYKGVDMPFVSDIIEQKFDVKDSQGNYKIFQYEDYMNDGKEFNDGIDFILDSIKKYPNEISLLCIGPLTNIGYAYKKDPETFNKLKEIFIMGGTFKFQYPDFNIRCDAESANEVLKTTVPIKFIGFDITRDATLSNEELDIIFESDKEDIKFLKDITQKYVDCFEGERRPTMHDPLALCMLKENFFTYKTAKISFDLLSKRKGKVVYQDDFKEVSYVDTCDYEGFKNLLLNKLKRK